MVREAVLAFNGDVQVEPFSSLKNLAWISCDRSWIAGLTKSRRKEAAEDEVTATNSRINGAAPYRFQRVTLFSS